MLAINSLFGSGLMRPRSGKQISDRLDQASRHMLDYWDDRNDRQIADDQATTADAMEILRRPVQRPRH